jgi:L-cysteine:1D-myo-inositol 2-amino-2-deoxy-alpha-D-glucopyranoside ligase
VLTRVRQRLADDLDTPGAIAAVDAWAAASLAEAESGSAAPAAQAVDDWDEQSPAVVRDLVDALLGIALTP